MGLVTFVRSEDTGIGCACVHRDISVVSARERSLRPGP